MSQPEEALQGLRFTLSHPVTAALPPANPGCLKLAMELAPKIKPLRKAEVAQIKEKGLAETPLFRYPRQSRASLPSDHYWTGTA
jgi:hypothetical protein